MTRPRTITAYDELLTASVEDPLVRWDLDPSAPVRAFAVPGAVGWVRPSSHHRRLGLVVIGAPAAAADLAVAALPEAPDVGVLTVTRGGLAHLERRLDRQLRGGADWDWLHCATAPPPRTGEDRVRQLGPHRWADVTHLLGQASPRAGTRPGDPDVLSWFGIDADAALVACGARTDHVPGVARLGAIATRPDRRGRGLGAAVTAALTRRALDEGRAAVTLGVYADNEVALALYRGLGFTRAHRLSTRLLVRSGAAGPSPTAPRRP